jgi:triosephosphate isomerase (TIM)
MRKKFVAGNWKMFTNGASGAELAAAVAKSVTDDRVTVAVCPPFPYLSRIAEVIRGSRIGLGAQNCYHETEGAFTGEVSPAMLKDVGCRYVILGHSERRHLLGETDAFVNKKVHAALKTGLDVIVCIGETLQQREANQTEAVLQTQLTGSLAGLDGAGLERVVLAYEPVWAIGTGKTATPEQAQEAHAFIRGKIKEMFGENTAQALLIQYGGSVKPDKVAALMREPDVDGVLVGGASLKADLFLAIIQFAT